MKKLFSIEESKYVFEWNDVVAFLTIVNVVCVMLGCAFAPWIAIGNCLLSLVLNVKYKVHLNLYVIQVALVILNIFFLKG